MSGGLDALASSSNLLSIDSNLGELSTRGDSVRSPRLIPGNDSVRFAASAIAGLKAKSPRAKRTVGVVTPEPTSKQQEISALEKKIEEAKSDLDGKLFLLRTQITRIEELERLVESGSTQLIVARRRREGEITDLEVQRRQLQLQLERQLAENRNTAAQLAATQAKNEGMSKGIRAQVVSLAETFSPRWASQDVRNLIRATAETNEEDTMSPEEEAEALRSVLDLRSADQRLEDVVRWKQERDAAEKDRAMRTAAQARSEAMDAEDDARAAMFEKRMAELQRVQSGSLEPPCDQNAFSTPTRPQSPRDRLFHRYKKSASHSIHVNAETLPVV